MQRSKGLKKSVKLTLLPFFFGLLSPNLMQGVGLSVAISPPPQKSVIGITSRQEFTTPLSGEWDGSLTGTCAEFEDGEMEWKWNRGEMKTHPSQQPSPVTAALEVEFSGFKIYFLPKFEKKLISKPENWTPSLGLLERKEKDSNFSAHTCATVSKSFGEKRARIAWRIVEGSLLENQVQEWQSLWGEKICPENEFSVAVFLKNSNIGVAEKIFPGIFESQLKTSAGNVDRMWRFRSGIFACLSVEL